MGRLVALLLCWTATMVVFTLVQRRPGNPELPPAGRAALVLF